MTRVSKMIAVDLDKAVLNDALITDSSLATVSNTTVASSQAIKTYVDSAVVGGGAVFTSETLTVTDNKITLTHEPKNGIIFNFATVRHVDEQMVSYDIPVTVTATIGGKEFILSPDTSGQFDSKSVMVQYAYTPAI